MQKLTKLTLLISAVLPASVLAETLEGVIVNSKGTAVAGAMVEIEGTSHQAKTDKQGRFSIQDLEAGDQDIHISALGYAHLHKSVDVSAGENKKIELVLERSPIEVIDVVSTPVHMSVMESSAPVSALSGEALRQQQLSTLGDSLEKLPGVHTNFHANVASTPVIRGLSGSRVMIAQNGLDVSDVSRVGPDHAVASEASTAEQIEVLRGPATLFYGSGAVGGVVNVVDGRVPKDNATRGEWTLETNSADDKKLAAFNLTTGVESIGLYADGYWRESSDYEVPTAENKIDNSAEKSKGLTLGASYLFDNGYFGAAVEQFERKYGIPGHSHGHEHSDESVYADLTQTRVQLLGEVNYQNQLLKQVKFKAGFSDYEHEEIENDAVGTVFENQTNEVNIDLLHSKFAGWEGGVSLHYKHSDVAAQGSEAFTPPSTTQAFAVSIIEEKRLGDLLLQVGGRAERVTLDADSVLLPNIDEHDHDDANLIRVFDVKQTFTPISLSTGIVWDFTEGYNLGLSLSRSQRAPAASELLSFGPHIGTRTYEVGALFAIEQHDDHSHVELSEQSIDLETANNLDFTLRKTQGDVGFVFNVFYNRIDNYYNQKATGLFADDGHNHDHDHEHDHDEHDHDTHDADEHEGQLPVYIFEMDDVTLRGFELQLAWQVSSAFKATLFSDYVRAKLTNGENLARTPPLRFGSKFNYQHQNISAQLDVTRYSTQDKVANLETATDGYTLVDASVGYDLPIFNLDTTVFLKGTNLTDTRAHVHTSFLKDLAPRPGRSVAVGLRGYF
ncbi:TonB-dependent receptor [Catenovulum agarivorans DS-2]|uniref:TonB-dependent receptor n=1 Tax=Catenovulum agarivorans DS-2 TaxID=1328313 RepID=W7QCX9_9ALTE|nr:TonB-dependent receptor [Catenovulum agarivorans]EWH09771.1 TonB-dependent receptor [Catenovulum agarivorans DS-2]